MTLMKEIVPFSIAKDQPGLDSLTAQVEQVLEERALAPKVVFAVQLVIDELVSNIIKYGTAGNNDSGIAVRLVFDHEAIAVEIEHEGERFNPFERADPVLDQPIEDREIGGLGIHLTRKVMDDCEFSYRDGRNVLVLRKKLELDGER